MKKDVIYIDIEDDITAVIDKLKKSPERIIALVPPKGNAVLQSVVNLKLLKRAADAADKRPVLVTNNQAQSALAGSLGMYVARNLQSKPEIPEAEVLTGINDAPVEVSDASEIAADTPTTVNLKDINDESEVELSEDEVSKMEATAAASSEADKNDTANKASSDKKADTGKDKKKKVPNFGSFRKKILIAGGAVLLLLIIGLFIFGKTKATISVRAQTTPVDIIKDAKFSTDLAKSDPETGNLKAEKKETKKTVTQSFTTTGKKNVGEKATGEVELSKLTPSATDVPAGTQMTDQDDNVFLTSEAVTIPASTPCFPTFCAQTVDVTVIAKEPGAKYNDSSGSLSAPNGINAAFIDETSGGTDKTVGVVTQADIDKARKAVTDQDNSAAQGELEDQFGDDFKILDGSFVVTIGAVSSEPGVDKEATEAKLNVEVTYTLLAVAKSDLGAMLDAVITEEMTDKDQQKVYENSLDSVKFEKVANDAKSASYKITGVGHYGPQFDEEQLKSDIAGKKYGEARSTVENLPGVNHVDIKLSPFWARQMPNTKRITIKLEVDTNNGG